MANMPDLLKVSSLEWALTHLEKFGDTDLLPVPFEYEAIKSDWPAIRELLSKRDLSKPMAGGGTRFLVPKPEGAFRVATRLDPLDAILYTASVYECAEQIEQARAAASTACSYRIAPAPDGTLFEAGAGWDTWTKHAAEKLAKPGVSHVVTADIVDFYSQISHHRVANALENAGVDAVRAKSIEDTLGAWSARWSRGLPVGPHASTVLAEACINDVDQHVAGLGYQHVRYVDDFRIFCDSEAQAIRALHDLCEYLYTSHRLALNPRKISINTVASFSRRYIEEPERVEQRKKQRKINEEIEALVQVDYSEAVDENDLDLSRINLAALGELFEECLKRKPLRLGVARYALRRAGLLRTNVIQSSVLENLELLLPVLRDVMVYLRKSKQQQSAVTVAGKLLEFGLASRYAFLPFCQEWVLDALTRTFPGTIPEQELARLAHKTHNALGIRGEALIARATNNLPWVRKQKEVWRNAGPWDKRAIIWAGSVLKSDERKSWKTAVLETADPLERAVALFALRPVITSKKE
jgi:hypothetical protein